MKEIEARISEIEKLEMHQASIDQIKELLDPLFSNYYLSTPVFDPGLTVFRGVKYQDKPQNISFLSYRKAGASQGRANRQNEPMFYGAVGRTIPFFELDVKAGEKLVVSTWRTTKPLLVNNIGYTDEVFLDLNSARENHMNEAENPNALTPSNILIRNFLAKNFSQRVNKENIDIYKLTIAIAERHYTSNLFQGLLYPTIAMRANGDNFAIKPSFIESGGLEFLQAEWIEVTKEQDFKYNINILDWANSVSEDGTIEWKGRLPQWTIDEGDELFFSYENGRQIAKNKEGKIVDPH